MLLATADGTAFPDATRFSGLTALDDRRVRALISSEAATARANAEPGARVSVLVTDITTYRSVMLRGTVLLASPSRTPGDLALVDQHVRAFVGAAEQVGMDPAKADRLFAVEVVPLVIEVDALVDKTPGPNAGKVVEVTG